MSPDPLLAGGVRDETKVESPLSGLLTNGGHYLWRHKINFLFLVSGMWQSVVHDLCIQHAPAIPRASLRIHRLLYA